MSTEFVESGGPKMVGIFKSKEGYEKEGRMPIVGYFKEEDGSYTAVVIARGGKVGRVTDVKGWEFLRAEFAEETSDTKRALNESKSLWEMTFGSKF